MMKIAYVIKNNFTTHLKWREGKRTLRRLRATSESQRLMTPLRINGRLETA